MRLLQTGHLSRGSNSVLIVPGRALMRVVNGPPGSFGGGGSGSGVGLGVGGGGVGVGSFTGSGGGGGGGVGSLGGGGVFSFGGAFKWKQIRSL